jgi:transcriptional regulator with XRE-family HTH domain
MAKRTPSSKGNPLLVSFRKQLGMTSEEFAAEAGISAGYLRQLETGVHALGGDAALRIWERFGRQLQRKGVSLEDLLRGQDAA